MYSLILMTAMSSAPQGPEFNGYFRNLFHGGGCYGTCEGRSNACYGTCTGWTLGSRVRAFFSFGGCGGCQGSCYGSCTGRSYACYGQSLTCQGCIGAYASCVGGQAFDPYQQPPMGHGMPAYPAPTYDPSPFAPAVPGAIPPVRGPGTDGVPFAPPSAAPPAVIDERGAFRTGPTARGTVVVKLPADARLYAEGRLLQLSSGERTFVTPELPTGRDYGYTFKVEYDRGGETVSQAKRVVVRPGQTTPIQFADLMLAKAPPEVAPKPTPANTTATRPADEPVSTPVKEADRPNPFKTPAGTTGAAERARITVKLPPGATLYIDDKKKDGTSPVREFTTPPLPPGKEFAYLMKVEVVRNGLPEQLFEKVVFRAGETVTRDFATLLPSDRTAR